MFHVTVFVKTIGSPALYNTVAVQVKVLDANDNAPVFSVPTIVLDVPENEGPIVLHVFRASDDDTGVNGLIFYYITGCSNFSSFFYVMHLVFGVVFRFPVICYVLICCLLHTSGIILSKESIDSLGYGYGKSTVRVEIMRSSTTIIYINMKYS